MRKKFIEYMASAPIKKAAPMVEAEGESSAAGWVAPVWRLDIINLNGRIYTTELAERLVAENATTTANDGHWAEGEYDCAKAVCHDPYIEDGMMWVHIDFIDAAYEALITSLVEKGVAIGVSSCGWGECDAYGHVMTNSYELIRYLDFVQTPAGEVYIQKNEETEDPEEEAEESSAEQTPPTAAVESLARDLTKIHLRRRKNR